MRICIASPDIVGPVANGGVGTACTALAQTLAAAGHEVTLFFTSVNVERGSAAEWQAFYAQFGVTLWMLDLGQKPPTHTSPTVYDEDHIARAYYVYEQLKQTDFDLIHFVDYVGLGYFTALARSQGLCLQNTTLAVTTHAPTLWSRLGNGRPVDDISYLVRDRLERGLVALCDLVISPSRYMLGWMRDQGWSLPERQVVLQNLMPLRSPDATLAPRTARSTIREIVFFGRLETRKGLRIFFDALDRINALLPPGLAVTLLGKQSSDFPLETLRARAERWGRKVTFLTEFDTFQALDYLRQDGRLVVLAALADNSPYTVLECLYYRLPFISSDVGGVPELVAAEDHARVLFAPTPAGLAACLLTHLEAKGGGFPPPRAAFRFGAPKLGWLALHEELAAERDARPAPPASMTVTGTAAPLVSVNILHYERPEGLRLALASIEQQSYPNIEIVVVDNGSRQPEARRYLDELERAGKPRLQVLRLADNAYEPAGRNAGAALSQGKYLLFMDDDNIAKPREVEVFAQVAERVGADILTCFNDHFTDSVPPASDAQALRRFVVVGDFGPLGLLLNSYGDLNCFCRRDRFLEIGGFTEDGRFNHAEDWRFFAKAWARGLTLAVVPEALLWYRNDAGAGWSQNWRKRDRGGALTRVAQEYLEVAPPEVAPFLRLAQGLFWKAVEAENQRGLLAQENQDLRRDKDRLATAQDSLKFSHDILLRNYRTLAEFVSSSIEPRLRDLPDMQRAIRHLQSVARKYD